MPVQWQNVSVQFVGGKDTKTDEKLVIPSKLIELQNAQVTEIGEIKKRNGFTSLSKKIADPHGASSTESSISSGVSVHDYNDQLVAIDGESFYSYSDASGKWVKRGAFYPVSIKEKTLATSPISSITDGPLAEASAELNGIRLVAYAAGFNSASYAEAFDVDTGLSIAKFKVSSSTIFAQTSKPVRVVAMKTKIAVIYIDGNSDIATRLFDTSTLELGSEQVLVAGTFTTMDACQKIDTKNECWVTGVSLSQQRVFYFDESATASSVLNLSAALGNASTTCYPAIECFGNGNAAVLHKDSSENIDLALIGYANPPTVNDSETSIWSSAGDVQNMTLLTYEVLPGFTDAAVMYVHYIDSTSGEEDQSYIQRSVSAHLRVLGTTSTPSTPVTVKQRADLASKPFRHNDKTYFLTRHTQFVGDGASYVLCVEDSDTSSAPYAHDIGMVLQGRVWYPDESGYIFYPDKPHLSKDGSWKFIVTATDRTYSVTSATRYEGRICEISIEPGVAPASADFADAKLFTGGILQMYDGKDVREVGFYSPPNPFSDSDLTPDTSGNLGQDSAYNYRLIYQLTDNNGRTHRSAVSDTAAITLSSGSAQDEVNISAPILLRGADDRQNSDATTLNRVRVAIYRTELGQSVFYNIGATGVSTSDTFRTTVADVAADSTINANELLYTESGEVENDPVPACRSIAVVGNRAFASVSGSEIRYSKEDAPFVGASFPAAFSKSITGRDDDVPILGALDDKVVIFRERSISYFYGDGPNDLGQGSFSEEIQLSSDVGCISPYSMLSTHMGLFFQSNKGIRLLTRGLQVHPQIGLEMDNIVKGKTIKAATLIQDKDECRFLLNDRVLVYNYVLNQWGEIPLDGTCGASATNWRGKYALLCANGTVKVENDGYKDDGLPYSLKVGTAWMKLGGAQGFQRVRRFSVLGTKSSKHTLVVKVYYDYEDKPADVFYFNSEDGVPAGSDVLQYSRRLSRQKCQAIRFEFEDEDLSENGEGYAISDLTLEAAVKPGINRGIKSRTFSKSNGWATKTTSTPAHGGHQHRHHYQGGKGGGS